MGTARARAKPPTRAGKAAPEKAPLDPELDDSSPSDDSASDEEAVSPPPTGKSNQQSTKHGKAGLKPRKHAAVVGDDGAASSVLYLGHLPRHFQEPEVLKFAKQFGAVRHVRLSRSRRTGGPRGYGFLQMAEPEVAVIAAGALSGYLLDGRRLVCHVVPPDRIHKNMVRTFAKPKAKAPRRERSLEQVRAVSERLLQRQALLKRKLQDAGIDYEFEGYTTAPAASDAGKIDAAGAKKTKAESTKKPPRKGSADAAAEPPATGRGPGRRRQASVGSESSSASRTARRHSGSADAPTENPAPRSRTGRTRQDSTASADSRAGAAPPVRRGAPRSERKPSAAGDDNSRGRSRRKSA